MKRFLLGIVLLNFVFLTNFCMGMTRYERHPTKIVMQEDERKDTKEFIGYLDAFRNIAEEILKTGSPDKQHKSTKPLSDTEYSWLCECIQTNQSLCYKITKRPGAVYREVCHLVPTRFSSNALAFWNKLLTEKKIDQKLYNKQVHVLNKFCIFFERLEKEGLICKYPRTVAGKTIYKSAL